ncbi:hypothetical protein M758_UG130700 [Ceratodon purpureus]|nr:hypothetical protein M758_UG130700 [Ceratodon purpureus]
MLKAGMQLWTSGLSYKLQDQDFDPFDTGLISLRCCNEEYSCERRDHMVAGIIWSQGTGARDFVGGRPGTGAVLASHGAPSGPLSEKPRARAGGASAPHRGADSPRVGAYRNGKCPRVHGHCQSN